MTTSVHSFILSHLCFLLFIVHVIYRPLFHFQFLGINSPILEEIASMNRTFTVNNRRINLIFPGVKRLLPFRFGLEVPATEVPWKILNLQKAGKTKNSNNPGWYYCHPRPPGIATEGKTCVESKIRVEFWSFTRGVLDGATLRQTPFGSPRVFSAEVPHLAAHTHLL